MLLQLSSALAANKASNFERAKSSTFRGRLSSMDSHMLQRVRRLHRCYYTYTHARAPHHCCHCCCDRCLHCENYHFHTLTCTMHALTRDRSRSLWHRARGKEGVQDEVARTHRHCGHAAAITHTLACTHAHAHTHAHTHMIHTHSPSCSWCSIRRYRSTPRKKL